MYCMCTHYESGDERHHIGDDHLHSRGVSVKSNVSEHHAVHQRSQQEVNVTDEDHAQAHLHQGLWFLQAATTQSWGGTEWEHVESQNNTERVAEILDKVTSSALSVLYWSETQEPGQTHSRDVTCIND